MRSRLRRFPLRSYWLVYLYPRHSSADPSGEFYRQFALTIAVSTAISAFVSLTLSPAMSALLLRPKSVSKGAMGRFGGSLFGWFFRGIDVGFDRVRAFYGRTVTCIIRVTGTAILVYTVLLGLHSSSFRQVPTGFLDPRIRAIHRKYPAPEGAFLCPVPMLWLGAS